MENKYTIKIENDAKFDDFMDELVDLIKKYELSYVEAFGILELAKIELGDCFIGE